MNEKTSNIFNSIWGAVAGQSVTTEEPTETTTVKKKNNWLPFAILGLGAVTALIIFK